MYILRRTHWGEEQCKLLAKEIPGLKIVNAHEDDIPQDDWCIRWATTTTIPGKTKVINKSKSISTVAQKDTFRKTMADAGLAPRTTINEPPAKYPVVIRPSHHSASKEVYIASNKKEFTAALKEMAEEDDYEGSYYTSAFIDKDKEFRVHMVSGRVVSMVEKLPADANEVSWGIGGEWKYIAWSDWPLEICRVASEAFKLSGLDFGALDMILKGKEAYCLEINTGPLLLPYYAEKFAQGIKYMIEKDDRSFIEPGDSKDFKAYIHPALMEAPR